MSRLSSHVTWPQWLQEPGPAPSFRAPGGLGRVDGTAGFHVSSFVLHGGNRHHGDECALLQRPVGRQDFRVPFFTTARPRLRESKEISTERAGEFGT